MPRENIISGGLDEAFTGSIKPDKRSRVTGQRSEGIIDDFGNESGGDSYAGKGVKSNAADNRGRKERPSDNSGMFESSFGSSTGRSTPKFTSSSSISRGNDIFDTDFGSARGNRLTPKTHSPTASSKSGDLFDREPATGADAAGHDGNAGPLRDDLVYGSEPPRPKSTDEYLTNDKSDIFSNGFGSDEAGWMSAKRKFGDKRYEKRIDERPAGSPENLSIGGNDIFATKIAVNPLETAEERNAHADMSKAKSVFGTDAHHEPAQSPYGEELPDERAEYDSASAITAIKDGFASESEVSRESQDSDGLSGAALSDSAGDDAGVYDDVYAEDTAYSGHADNAAGSTGAPQMPQTAATEEHSGISFRSEADLHFGKDTSDDLYDDHYESRPNRPKAVAYTMEDDLREQRRLNREAGADAAGNPADSLGTSGGNSLEYDESAFDELTSPVSESQGFEPNPDRDPLYAGYTTGYNAGYGAARTPAAANNPTVSQVIDFTTASDGDFDDIFEDEDTSQKQAATAPMQKPAPEPVPQAKPEEKKPEAKKFNYMETDDSDLFED